MHSLSGLIPLLVILLLESDWMLPPHDPSPMPGLVDLAAGLESLRFDHGMPENHRGLIKLKSRCCDMIGQACADSAFLCRLLLQARQRLQEILCPSAGASLPSSLHVGVIGGGHIGKRIIRSLLELPDLQPSNLSVSTRRPETLRDLQDMGIHCFYDNSRLVKEAQLVFLCCLPSQLPAVCAEIRPHLTQRCLLYSLVTGVPLLRLENLLCHSNIIRPEFQSPPTDDGHSQHMAPMEGSLVGATMSRQPQNSGELTLTRILQPAAYALLNMCSSHGATLSQSLSLLNGLLQPPSGGSLFTGSDFVMVEWQDRPLPWFELTGVQRKETPLSRRLTQSPELCSQLLHLYHHPDCQRAQP